MKLKVTQVTFGTLTIEGLVDDSGVFYVSASQIAGLFQLLKNNATREVKALLPKDSQLPKFKTELNPKAVNVLTLSQFRYVAFQLAFKGNEFARFFCEMLTELSLEQVFSDAFGIKFESADRQALMTARIRGIYVRRTLTDALKDFGFKSEDPTIYGRITMKCYHKLGLYELYAEWKACPTKKPFRDTLSQLDLLRLERLEDWVVRKYSQGYQPDAAISMY